MSLPVQGKPTVLLVEDDAGVRESLRRTFITENWNVVTADGGETALVQISRQVPDILITDLRMGGINGWDLLFHESAERPSFPIFVVSALPPEAAAGADVIATRFFQKPLDIEALLRAARNVVQTKHEEFSKIEAPKLGQKE